MYKIRIMVLGATGKVKEDGWNCRGVILVRAGGLKTCNIGVGEGTADM